MLWDFISIEITYVTVLKKNIYAHNTKWTPTSGQNIIRSKVLSSPCTWRSWWSCSRRWRWWWRGQWTRMCRCRPRRRCGPQGPDRNRSISLHNWNIKKDKVKHVLTLSISFELFMSGEDQGHFLDKFSVREAFIKKKKDEICHLGSDPPPPPLRWRTIFYFFFYY